MIFFLSDSCKNVIVTLKTELVWEHCEKDTETPTVLDASMVGVVMFLCCYLQLGELGVVLGFPSSLAHFDGQQD